jgi:hypothetical protein
MVCGHSSRRRGFLRAEFSLGRTDPPILAEWTVLVAGSGALAGCRIGRFRPPLSPVRETLTKVASAVSLVPHRRPLTPVPLSQFAHQTSRYPAPSV